jgi:hypothetical protein
VQHRSRFSRHVCIGADAASCSIQVTPGRPEEPAGHEVQHSLFEDWGRAGPLHIVTDLALARDAQRGPRRQAGRSGARWR